MELLQSPIRGYAWGSHTAIATLQGRPSPTPQPEAELWMGAHPGSPSRLAVSGTPLTDAIEADPVLLLGEASLRRFGRRLPFLLKVLAAAAPLSLQAHPDLEQARAGYAAEEHSGAHLNYNDPWHKPEMLVAIDGFDALCGFRDPRLTAAMLEELDVDALKSTVQALRQNDVSSALRDAVQGLLMIDNPATLVLDVAAAAGPDSLAGELAAAYPGDVGVIIAMLLNRVSLTAGQAVWMPAGNLHAYLEGLGVEIMAASDNVLRGGLTPKHVDVPELLKVLRFEVLDNPVRDPEPVSPGLVTWPVPIDDFALHRAVVGADLPAVALPGEGPRIVLCLAGEVRADDGVSAVRLHPGEAAFCPAGRGAVAVSGDGEVFQASSHA